MLLRRLRRSASCGSPLCYIAGFSLTTVAQTTPANPTANEAPEAIDQTWQKASAKYDGARAAILANVDHVNSEGPFRPNWVSLQAYKVPEWYMDAKFGIFIH